MTDHMARGLAIGAVIAAIIIVPQGFNDDNGQQNVHIDRLERAVQTPHPTTTVAPTTTAPSELDNTIRDLAGRCGAGFTVTVDRAGRVTGHCLNG